MDDDEKKDVDQKKEAFDAGPRSPSPVEAPKKARKAPKKAPVEAAVEAPVEAAVEPPPRLQPMFFVELGTTLKQMRHAERAHRISSLKIA
jgi:hypothetical protein